VVTPVSQHFVCHPHGLGRLTKEMTALAATGLLSSKAPTTTKQVVALGVAPKLHSHCWARCKFSPGGQALMMKEGDAHKLKPVAA